MQDTAKLTLYNSLTREKEVFTPQDASRVTMYNCGPTVYSYAHIGNARAAVVADVLFRVLRHIYGEDSVVYARNITDVDDKIIAAAKEQGVDISEITEKYTKIYQQDLAALGCLPPTHQPKATEHIQHMADIIITLLDKDIAYHAQGHVLFDVTKKDDYGKLSGRKLGDNLAGARVEVAGYKRNAGDFILWKPAKADEPGWSQQEGSTAYKVNWGKYGNQDFAVNLGRPGWHIECSAMAKATLGETIDIHCGGVDLKFPHHENEIAQSECASGKDFARFWVHNEFLNMAKDDGSSEKMSKSLGNVTLVHDLLKDWDGEVIRLALLKAHYRSELKWSAGLLRISKAQLDGWYRKLALIPKPQPKLPRKFTNIFYERYLNNLDTVTAIFSIDVLTNSIVDGVWQHGRMPLYFGNQKTISTETKIELSLYLQELSNLLGLLQKDPDEWFSGGASDDERAATDALVTEYDSVRAQAMTAKAAGDKAVMGAMFKRSDELRDQFKQDGIILETGPNGSTWRKA